ncbi:MAG: chromosomal replication initiator protein DnaA [Candidatus Sungiibacteriota bacterium]
MENHELWQTVLAKIELTLSRPNFLTWFRDTDIARLDDKTITLSVPNGFAREWLQNKHHKAILHALRETNPDIKEVVYTIGPPPSSSLVSPFKNRAVYQKHSAPPSFLLEDEHSLRDLSLNPETGLNPRYTFSNFIVGSFNELAHAAARSIIKNPGTSYNPLFVYGGVGLGKTHLIQAVGNELIANNPHIKVRYVPSEKYMVEIVEALRNQSMNALKEKYRSIDLLIMDDIQFIAKTEKMQEEFFHTFNVLYEKNKQIIISSDKPPAAIPTLAGRLRSRFEGGMIADVGLPDMETRLTILKKKAETKEIALSEDVLRMVAEQVTTNIRELEGALNQLVMASKLSASPINVETAKKIMMASAATPKKFLSPKKIIKAVADFYDMSEKDIIQQSRKKDVVRPRQIAMYLMREYLKNSYPSIGDKFGGRDHTTVIHSCEKVGQEVLINPELVEELKAIRESILLV